MIYFKYSFKILFYFYLISSCYNIAFIALAGPVAHISRFVFLHSTVIYYNDNIIFKDKEESMGW